MDYKDRAYKAVKRIPKGRVVTYGDISNYINSVYKTSITPRMVGRALHQNPDPKNIPCHRVVDRNGRIAENFAFGGAKEQRKRLLVEGVKFRDQNHVDLSCRVTNL